MLIHNQFHLVKTKKMCKQGWFYTSFLIFYSSFCFATLINP